MAIRYRKFAPTEYVIKVKNGRYVKQGLGLSFFYNTMTTGLLVIPATAMDSAFIFDDLMTSDFQNVGVQGDITYAISDYEKAAKTVDFFYRDSAKSYGVVLAAAKGAITKRITNLAKVMAAKLISGMDIKTAIKAREELAAYLKENMKQEETVREYGIDIISVSILGINPTAETRRALEAAAREEILKQQDDAIYKRRNSAIEQERLVKENELNTEIRVAEKEKEKREKEMETKRLVFEKQAELENRKVENGIALEKQRVELIDLETENERKKSDARAYDSQALLKTFENTDPELIKALVLTGMDSKSLIAKAFVEIGSKADKIGNLSISPELLEALAEK